VKDSSIMMQQPGIQRIAQQIVETFDPRRITLFGSRARGDARPDSDVDLMVEMESDQPPLERMRRVYRACRDRVLPLDARIYARRASAAAPISILSGA
jgi:predicted nucleotidyltransferase